MSEDVATAQPGAAPEPPRFDRGLITAIVVTCLLLLVLVISVGLIRGTLDTIGVAIVLSTMITGILTGVAFKRGA